MAITTVSRWGNPRAIAAHLERQAALAPRDELAHNLTHDQVQALHDRFEQFMPRMASRFGVENDLLDEVLPKGASWSDPLHRGRQGVRRQANGFGGASFGGDFQGNTLLTPQRPYQPEFESPDRQHYPVHRILANRYWRLFYKLDGVAGPVVDMISDLPYSDFTLTGEGVDGEIKDRLEKMCEETKLRSRLPAMTKEFFVVGEACPHLFYDDGERIWTHIAIHNPDQLEVIHSPFLPNMEPLVQFIPDDRLRQIVTSSHPILAHIRQSMPPDLVARIQARENITLSPLNYTHIARKMHDYDVRGTSIYSRLWRAFMLEDGVFAAAIATARRNASPLKVAKLGDPNTNWIPGPDQERKLTQMIAQQETDPGAWIVWHYGLNFELVGIQERVLPITQYYPLIEQMKLGALGVSKSFISGEVSYSSAAAGLTVFLQRLKTLRDFFESIWLYPKFFRPIAEMNEWVKPTDAELKHRVRVKRSVQELRDRRQYIIPKIKWEKSLDPNVDTERVNAMTSLEGLGLKFSKKTKMAAVGIDYETELKQIVDEVDMEQEIVGNNTAAALAAGLIQPPAGEGAPGGAGGLPTGGGAPMPTMVPGMPPPDAGPGGDIAPGEPLDTSPGGGAPGGAPGPGPEGASVKTKADDEKAKAKSAPNRKQDATPGTANWSQPQVRALLDLFSTFDTTNVRIQPWSEAVSMNSAVMEAVARGDADELWHGLEAYLLERGYPDYAIMELQGLLESRHVIAAASGFGTILDGMSRSFFTGY